MKIKKNLCGKSLLSLAKNSFERLGDHRSSYEISLPDAFLSGLAVFKLKMPSLLKFEEFLEEENHERNLKNIFSIEDIPSDTQLRSILDKVPYHELFTVYKDIFRVLKNEKAIDKFKYDIPGEKPFYLVSSDGTGFFSSSKVRCDHCLVKKIKNKDEDDELMYHHQMLGSAIVHPQMKTVLPFAPEPIMAQDGLAKNDCERNSIKRFFYRLKDDHPGLRFCILADALHSTVDNFKLIKGMNWNAIIGVKPDSHKTLFKQMRERSDEIKEVTIVDEIGDKVKKKRTRIYRFGNGLFMTLGSDLEVNVLDFEEKIEWEGKRGPTKKISRFTWATTIELNENNIYHIMKAGRSRWKCENEVFNTLKNQGYHLEHNYGHGKENLSANFAILMFLAFLMDQIEETFCDLFKKAREKLRTKYSLWENIRVVFHFFNNNNWTELIYRIVYKESGAKLKINTS